MSDKYDEVNGGFKEHTERGDEPDSLLQSKKVELDRSLGVLAALPERVYSPDDNPYAGWNESALAEEIEKLKQRDRQQKEQR